MTLSNFDFDYSKQKSFVFGLFSDLHIDSIGCDWQRLQADFDHVVAENGRILINGDLVDGIFPTDRKRFSRSGNVSNDDAQINSVVEYVTNKLLPYADYIDYIGFGNHEVTIVKFNNLDIISLIVYNLNQARNKKLQPIQRGGYVGFVNLSFRIKDGSTRRFVIYRDHGKGGNSPVTKGTIALQRLYATFDADLYWLGHSHQSIIDSQSQWSIGISSQGNIYKKPKIGIITPGYQNCFTETSANELYKLNFPEERFHAPTGLGYGLLKINLDSKSNINSEVCIK